MEFSRNLRSEEAIFFGRCIKKPLSAQRVFWRTQWKLNLKLTIFEIWRLFSLCEFLWEHWHCTMLSANECRNFYCTAVSFSHWQALDDA